MLIASQISSHILICKYINYRDLKDLDLTFCCEKLQFLQATVYNLFDQMACEFLLNYKLKSGRMNDQLGPQQLRYMTFLRDSSDCFTLSCLKLETKTEDEEENLLA
ncbi:hypothetical protein C1H46_036032 [Malus baccata]|uniref:Uncharacterized protein n=1 Tax=Malus baccata TaxID=106549 RepID=A0A540KW04_MALBA|nr:hypothetical protein C1H46_036032 [Malus baccata]